MKLARRNGWPFVPSFFDSDVYNDFYNGNEFSPAVNIHEDEKNYEVELAVPGMKKDDFKVNVDDDVLTISAEHKDEKNEKEKNYTRKEFSYSSFQRSFKLPEQRVNVEKIEAKYNDGILKLTLPKMVPDQPKQRLIEIS